eukprot:2976759-Rhodomonas_salina.2
MPGEHVRRGGGSGRGSVGGERERGRSGQGAMGRRNSRDAASCRSEEEEEEVDDEEEGRWECLHKAVTVCVIILRVGGGCVRYHPTRRRWLCAVAFYT